MKSRCNTNIKDFLGARFSCVIEVANNNKDDTNAIGYFDYVRIGAIEDDPTIYDNFNNSTYDGKFDTTKWKHTQQEPGGSAIQQDGALIFTQSGVEKGQELSPLQPIRLQESTVFEAVLKNEFTRDGQVVMGIAWDNEYVSCGLHSMSDAATANCWTQHSFTISYGTWHVIRMEVDVDEDMITLYIDDKQLGVLNYDEPLKGKDVYLNINVGVMSNRTNETRPMIGYVDSVRIYPLEYIKP